MEKKIAVIKGDGIGPEIVEQALKVLEKVSQTFGHTFHYEHLLAGGCAIDATGECLPQSTIDCCKQSDAVLLGAVGGPTWDAQPSQNRPEKALLRIREELGLFANVRPASLFPQLKEACPLKESIVAEGIDFVVVRELTGGIYFGTHATSCKNGVREACDTLSYNELEIERIARVAFETALLRNKRVVSVDKANVLDSSRLWREVSERVALEYPTVSLTHMYVDNAAMQLVRRPSQFDVILTENMFGDILSDEASMISGTIGIIPSSSMGEGTLGMYEPIHGSAPDIAGQDVANPIGTILSAAMMLKYSFHMEAESNAIEAAVNAVLNEGYRSKDMMSEGMTLVGCQELGDRIAQAL